MFDGTIKEDAGWTSAIGQLDLHRLHHPVQRLLRQRVEEACLQQRAKVLGKRRPVVTSSSRINSVIAGDQR